MNEEMNTIFTDVNGIKMTMPCDKLLEALSKMQGVLDHAKKDSDNPYFKSKYADLAKCLSTIKKPMADVGLSITQHCSFDGQFVSCVTVLGHSSGQMIISTLNVPVTKRDAQGIGSGITYARRYSLSAVVGLAQADDDGNGAVGSADDDKKKTKWEETAEKAQAMLHNQDTLDSLENWRMISPDNIEIKGNDGNFYPLEMLNKNQLQKALNNELFADIKKYIEAEIKKK